MNYKHLLQYYATNHTDIFPDVFNIILVHASVRNACMIQQIDHTTNNFKILLRFVSLLDLKHVKINQGYLIMNINTMVPFNTINYTHTQLGQFLSYPYAGDIHSNRNFVYRLSIIFNGDNGDKSDKFHIISMVAGKMNSKKAAIFEQSIKAFIYKHNLNIFLQSHYLPIYSISGCIDAVNNYNDTNQIDDSIVKYIVNVINNSGFFTLQPDINYTNEQIIYMLKICQKYL
jgi:hypothetical protein